MRPIPSGDQSPLRRVAAVDLAGIAEALDDASGETIWWYDPATGQVEMTAPYWASLEEDEDDPSERGLVPIEPLGSRRAYQDMVDFTDSVADARASDLLRRALEGRGAFRRFRDTLHEFPDLREHWHTFNRVAGEVRAIDWLVDGDHVEPLDAETERAARADILEAVLAAIDVPTATAIDEADLADRWDQVRTAIDAGQAVTVVRDGRPWATISPRPPK